MDQQEQNDLASALLRAGTTVEVLLDTDDDGPLQFAQLALDERGELVVSGIRTEE